MIRIFVDFNYSTKLLPLRFNGSFEDIRRQHVELREGMHIILYDDMCQAEAIVENIQGEMVGTSHQRNDQRPRKFTFTIV
jgi:hypothetical protein